MLHHPSLLRRGLGVWPLALLLVALAAGPGLADEPATDVYLPVILKGAAAPTPTATPTATVTPTPTVQASSDLHIIELEPMGQHEYITLRNQGTADQPMTGWRLISVVGPQIYAFHDEFVLAAGATVRLHSGPAAPAEVLPTDLLWSTGHIWRNLGDRAILRNADGDEVDSHRYGDLCP